MPECRDARRARATRTRAVPAIAACLATFVLTGGKTSAGGTADGELTLFLAGDAIITQPWSADRDPAFLALVDRIRAADAALVNLELVLHDKGYPQADTSGGYMAARPAIAAELAELAVTVLEARK